MNLNKILLLLLTVVVCSACVQDDDFTTPKVTIEEPILDLPVLTIDDLISNFNQEFLGYIGSLGLDPDNFADQEAQTQASFFLHQVIFGASRPPQLLIQPPAPII